MKVLIWGGEARYRADLPARSNPCPWSWCSAPGAAPLGSMLPSTQTQSFSSLTPSRRWTAPLWTGCPACG